MAIYYTEYISNHDLYFESLSDKIEIDYSITLMMLKNFKLIYLN